MCSRWPFCRSQTIEDICIKIMFISEMKIILLSRSSNVDAVNTLCNVFIFIAAERTFLGLQKMLDDTIKIISKASLSEELKKITLNKGFVISDNHGEGNCMFYALSEQLDLVKRIHVPHGELRQRLVQYLEQNPTLVSCYK